MRAILDRLLWRVYRAVFKPVSVNGMPLVDIRVETEDAEVIRQTLHAAMGYISEAGDEFRQLVSREVDFVAATREPAERVSKNLRAYLSPFQGYERSNSFFLACRIVGVAEYFRQLEKGEPDDPEARRRAVESELAFAARFPNSDDWIQFLKRSPIGR
jgi:hypothetical protein